MLNIFFFEFYFTVNFNNDNKILLLLLKICIDSIKCKYFVKSKLIKNKTNKRKLFD